MKKTPHATKRGRGPPKAKEGVKEGSAEPNWVRGEKRQVPGNGFSKKKSYHKPGSDNIKEGGGEGILSE